MLSGDVASPSRIVVIGLIRANGSHPHVEITAQFLISTIDVSLHALELHNGKVAADGAEVITPQVIPREQVKLDRVLPHIQNVSTPN